MTWRCPGCHQEIAIVGGPLPHHEVVEHWKPDPPYRTWIYPWNGTKLDNKPIDAWLRCEWSGAKVRIDNNWGKP